MTCCIIKSHQIKNMILLKLTLYFGLLTLLSCQKLSNFKFNFTNTQSSSSQSSKIYLYIVNDIDANFLSTKTGSEEQYINGLDEVCAVQSKNYTHRKAFICASYNGHAVRNMVSLDTQINLPTDRSIVSESEIVVAENYINLRLSATSASGSLVNSFKDAGVIIDGNEMWMGCKSNGDVEIGKSCAKTNHSWDYNDQNSDGNTFWENGSNLTSEWVDLIGNNRSDNCKFGHIVVKHNIFCLGWND